MASTNITLLLVCLPLLVIGVTTTRRLMLHPLRAIPGPTMAAVTRLYSFYYNVILPWRFGVKIHQLHQRYGETMPCKKTFYSTYVSKVP